MDAYRIRCRMIALLAGMLVVGAPSYGQYAAGYSPGYQDCPCPQSNNGGQSQSQSGNRDESGVTITDQNQDANGTDQNTNNQTDSQSQTNDSNASAYQRNGQSAESSASNLSSTQSAGSNPNMIGDFFGLPSNRQLFFPTGQIGVADIDPAGPPGGPLKIVSRVDQVGPAYIYHFSPAPFGEFLITNTDNVNNDQINDFALKADPTKVPVSGLRTDIDYAAISQGIITPSGHDLYGIYEMYLIPNPSAAELIGRVRLQDNNSAMPQDRWFVGYDNFQNVPLTSNGVTVNRVEPGFEKTFFNGNTSIEVRVPMAMTVNSVFVADGPPDTSNFEFGDVAIAPKLLLEGGDLCTAVGCGISFPTADDLEVNRSDDTRLLRANNESVHLVPYVAFYMPPIHSNFFGHVFITGDFEANGSSVSGNVNGTGLEHIGTWNSQNLGSINAAIGSWLYRGNVRNCQPSHGLAWATELHYTKTLNDSDFIQEGNFRVGSPDEKISILDATIGLHYQVGKAMLTAAYSVPVTDQRVFDGQLRMFLNRYLY